MTLGESYFFGRYVYTSAEYPDYGGPRDFLVRSPDPIKINFWSEVNVLFRVISKFQNARLIKRRTL
jgi:hypothetical protein